MIKTIFIIMTTLLSSVCFAEQKVYNIKWVLAHEPARVFEKAANEFASRIDKKTNGQIKVEVVKLAELSEKKDGQVYPVDAAKAFSMLQAGKLQMSQTYSTFLGNQNKQMWILDLPFLFKNHEHASRVLDGQIGQKLMAGLEKSNVKGLAFTYSGGYRIIPSETKALSSMASFQGEKINVSKDSPVAQAYLKELGATPMPVADASGFKQLKNGGFETTYARLSLIKNVTAKYVNETEHSLFLTTILINKDFFNSLPNDLQKAIQETSYEIAKIERQDSIQDAVDYKNDLIKNNKMTVVSMSTSEKEKMKTAAKPVYEAFSKLLDQDIIVAIQNEK